MRPYATATVATHTLFPNLILDETVTPVCSLPYAQSVGGLRAPDELLRCTLLHEERMLANWEQWFSLAGVEAARVHRGAAYSHGSLAIDAAIRGEGVALARSVLVTDDIVASRLDRALFTDQAQRRTRI